MSSARLGSVIGASFGLVFVVVNAGSSPAAVAVPLRVLAALTFIWVLITVVMTRVRPTPASDERPAAGGFTLGYWVVVGIEVGVIAAGLAVLNGPVHAPHAAVAWIALVVGVHFIALALVWKLPFFHGLGAALILCGAAGLGLSAAGTTVSSIDLVGGVLPGAILLGFGLWGATRSTTPASPVSASSRTPRDSPAQVPVSDLGPWTGDGTEPQVGAHQLVVGHDSGVTMTSTTVSNCPGCQVRLPALDAPAHPYMTCSPACWVRYGDLLAAQYSDPERMAFHQIVVDSYAVQHPDGDDPRAIQSVGIHLMTLCLFLERGADPCMGTRLHRFMVDRPVFHHLTSPSSRGRLTMLDVPLTGDPATARRAAYAWADDAWTAWAAHHRTVRDWVDRSGLGAYT